LSSTTIVIVTSALNEYVKIYDLDFF